MINTVIETEVMSLVFSARMSVAYIARGGVTETTTVRISVDELVQTRRTVHLLRDQHHQLHVYCGQV